MYQVIGSNDMTVVEMLTEAMLRRGVKKKYVAEKMGWSSQNFSNRLKNCTLDAEEWVKVAKILGYEVIMVEEESRAVLKPRNKSTGESVKQYIDGFTYDTDKATSICHSPKLYGGWFELFKDVQSGKFFTVAYFETGKSACVAKITKEDAEKFYEDCGGEDKAEFFGE